MRGCLFLHTFYASIKWTNKWNQLLLLLWKSNERENEKWHECCVISMLTVPRPQNNAFMVKLELEMKNETMTLIRNRGFEHRNLKMNKIIGNIGDNSRLHNWYLRSVSILELNWVSHVTKWIDFQGTGFFCFQFSMSWLLSLQVY